LTLNRQLRHGVEIGVFHHGFKPIATVVCLLQFFKGINKPLGGWGLKKRLSVQNFEVRFIEQFGDLLVAWRQIVRALSEGPVVDLSDLEEAMRRVSSAHEG
jgi:hypothetical protein